MMVRERRINMLRGPPQPDDNPHNDGERHINMLQVPPELGQPTPYDTVAPNVTEETAADVVPL